MKLLLIITISIFSSSIFARVGLEDENFCFIGDSGQGNPGQYEVADALEKLQCSEVRILGDVIYPDGLANIDDPLLVTNFLNPYKKLLAAKTPFYIVVGNHDYHQDPTVWPLLAQRYPQIHIPSLYYTDTKNFADGKKICSFTLDTTPYDGFWAPSPEQTKWFRKTLAESKSKCDLTLVLAHHPYISSGAHGNANKHLKKFLESEVIGKVDMYITGHDHQLSHEGVVKGTTLLISGSGAEVRPLLRTPKVFGASQLGVLVLKYKQNAEGKVQAHYSFIGVDKGQLTLIYEGLKTAKGVR